MFGLGVAAVGCSSAQTTESAADEQPKLPLFNPDKAPIVLSTWNHGLPANAAAWAILNAKGNALDAVEKGVMVTESDPENRSVGLAGMPDRDGFTTLDACCINPEPPRPRSSSESPSSTTRCRGLSVPAGRAAQSRSPAAPASGRVDAGAGPQSPRGMRQCTESTPPGNSNPAPRSHGAPGRPSISVCPTRR